MRAVVWDMPWDDEYDDLSSFEPGVKRTRRVLAEPPLPPAASWGEAKEVALSEGRPNRLRVVAGTFAFLALSTCAFLMLSMLRQALPAEERAAEMWIGGVLIAYGVATALLCRWAAGGRTPASINRLAHEVGIRESYPVRVRVIQNGNVTGADFGVAWFHKDALHFRGLETSFVLGAQNLRFDPMAFGVGHGALQHGWVTPTLTLRHPERMLAVQFVPFGRFDKSDQSDRGYRFRHNLRLFLSHWRESHVPSVYPPLEPHPARATRRNRAVVQVAEREVAARG